MPWVVTSIVPDPSQDLAAITVLVADVTAEYRDAGGNLVCAHTERTALDPVTWELTPAGRAKLLTGAVRALAEAQVRASVPEAPAAPWQAVEDALNGGEDA